MVVELGNTRYKLPDLLILELIDLKLVPFTVIYPYALAEVGVTDVNAGAGGRFISISCERAE